MSDAEATRRVLRLAQPPLRRFLPGVLFGALSALCAVGLLATSAYLITRAAEQPPILYLMMAIVGVRAFALGRAVFRYLERLFSHDASFRQLAELRVGVLERLLPLAPDGLARSRRGDLLSRLVRDVDELQDHPLRVVQPLVSAVLVCAAAVALVWVLLPAAGITLAIALLLAAVIGTAADTAVAARAEREVAPLRARLADLILDLTGNLEVLTAYGALDAERARLDRADERLRAATLRLAAGAGVVGALVSVIAGAATIAALLVGAPEVAAGGLSGPVLAVVALVPIAVFEVFAAVPAALGAWRRVRSSAQRIATVVPQELPPEIPADIAADGAAGAPAPRAERIEPAPGTPLVSLRDVAARWPGGEAVLHGLDLDLAAGDRVVVSGASGAGKTTLAHVLVRFLDYSGSYRVGGVEARELAHDEVRRVVGLCEQSPYLFDSDIRQNLLFARDTASDEELTAVLDRVGLGDWLAERGGLDATVGERGQLVSGGQAQRIALARALLADFPVLVVDEPTANVDAERAEELLRDILALGGDDARAVLVISHTEVPGELVTRRLELRGGGLFAPETSDDASLRREAAASAPRDAVATR
ncbi:thiol reductant ABC exporter subunit CydC [Compostimonas suwonensis]|uniref:ATP-binding cassette subfamily C protein CydC n=1 Tax=Compostimonas suwonensis TaxID=1048394 RepID=A0A2M9BZ64_9MICO|nr:thiol reductant ABC exporter subunit CydC [Compostimonas suwonensis]PJJ63379.1 ATP-binding cassette subfamily C protein CydC [Compostimonas suwonensis]